MCSLINDFSKCIYFRICNTQMQNSKIQKLHKVSLPALSSNIKFPSNFLYIPRQVHICRQPHIFFYDSKMGAHVTIFCSIAMP